MHAPLPEAGWWRWEIAALLLGLIPAGRRAGGADPVSSHVAPRPDPDPPDWYDDHAWETSDDAHRVTFEPIPRRSPAAYPLHDHHPAEEAPHVRDHADP